MSSQWFAVYKVKSQLMLRDPHMPPGRLHHAIFVETEANGSGALYEVTGDITSQGGMIYQTRASDKPSSSDAFHSQELLGYTAAHTHPEQWDALLRSLPTPPQQKAPNVDHAGRVEPFRSKNGDYYVFYKPEEEMKPLWKCTEWTEWYAIPALRQHGLVQAHPGTE